MTSGAMAPSIHLSAGAAIVVGVVITINGTSCVPAVIECILITRSDRAGAGIMLFLTMVGTACVQEFDDLRQRMFVAHTGTSERIRRRSCLMPIAMRRYIPRSYMSRQK